MRISRQNRILELIEKHEIGSQKDLADCLKEYGFDVTQATVSRDIRELQIVKTLSPSGKYAYSLPNKQNGPISNRLKDLLRSTVKSVSYSENVVLVKCLPGCANAVGEAIDTMDTPYVIGSVAGDNTLLMVVDETKKSEDVVDFLRIMLEKKREDE